jgi:hypothetical protein
MKSLYMIMYDSKYSAQLKIANNYHIRLRINAYNKTTLTVKKDLRNILHYMVFNDE